jgi:DNA mismatch endonuclease (patch repair protein)
MTIKGLLTDPSYIMRVACPLAALWFLHNTSLLRHRFVFMTDKVSREVRSHIMSRIRSCGNQGTEKRMIEIFRTYSVIGWRRGRDLPGRPDFTFHPEKLVVFVDGCFWHGCPIHGRTPTSNRDYWQPKLERNKRRDRLLCKQLRSLGWKTLRVWQHELTDESTLMKKLRQRPP